MPKVKKIQHSKVHSDGDKIKVSFTQPSSKMNCSRSSSNLSGASYSSLLTAPVQESALALQQSTIKLKHSQSTKAVSHLQNNIRSTLNHTKSEVGISRTRSGSITLQNQNNMTTTNSSLIGGRGSSPETTLGHKHNKSDTTGLNKKLNRKGSKRSISKRSNRNFHQLFPSVPTDEIVIDTYSCALVKSGVNLLHGVMFLSKNYICFYSKILTAENILIIKLQHINSIKKTMHALIFPTAIRIETQNSSYQFTSFRSRSNTLEHLIQLLGNYQAQLASENDSLATSSQTDTISKAEQNPVQFNQDKNSANTTSTDLGSDGEDDETANTSNDTEHNMTDELLSQTDDECHQVDANNNVIRKGSKAYEMRDSPCGILNRMAATSSASLPGHQPYYDIDYSDLSNRKVTVSLRQKQTLTQKLKILVGLLIPAFFDISRIDSLLPICFLMCILLLLNAFVLLNQVSKVDELFADLLVNSDMVLS